MTEAVPLTDAERVAQLLQPITGCHPQAKNNIRAYILDLWATIDKDRQEIAALREKLARAREALEPFAEAAEDEIALKEARSNTYFMFDDDDLRKAAEVHAELSAGSTAGDGK